MRAMFLLPFFFVGCGDDPLTRVAGSLEVTAINAAAEATEVLVEARRGDALERATARVERPGTVLLLGRMDPGDWGVRVEARDARRVPLQAISVERVQIRANLLTRLLVDLSTSPRDPPEPEDPGRDPPADPPVDPPADPPEDPQDPPVDPPEAQVGCADGQREGFLSLVDHPDIAGCSGGWSLPGLTSGPAPACGRAAGDDATNPSGDGCTAADLCAAGWHVCDGKADVALRSATGCAGAVPPGTPDKSLFFAVRQSSLQGSACTDDGSGDNDVFGCGNLGNPLGADKNCAPLDRVLASTQPNTCGFNEAEPPLGPWQCLGGGDSHFHEGALVTKSACNGGDCSYDGRPVSTWDKGGVLCCRDY